MMRFRAVSTSIAAGLLGGIGLAALFITVHPVPAHAQAVSQPVCDTQEQRAKCQNDYNQLEAEIAQWQKVLDTTEQQKGSLQGDVTKLNAQIKQAQAQIAAKNIAISSLAHSIDDKTATINQLQSQVDQGKDSLASLIRQEDELDAYSAVDVAFSSDDVSTFFADLDAFASVEKGMQSLFGTIQSAQNSTAAQRQQLAAQQSAAQNAKAAVETQKQQISTAEANKQQLLTQTAKQADQYQQVIAQRQAQAAAIRSALFKLRDASGIPFGTALQYAQVASARTGVRAALILAFLSQESDLGVNVGSCLVTDITTGDGKGKNTGRPFIGVMKAPRDTVPFLAIASALGISWQATPVSCPQAGGYGGAMGPAQFIPSTWQLYAPRIASALRVTGEPDPWNPQDAIMANALYIADLGAGAGTPAAESSAACKYFSGSGCGASPTIASYGASVLAKANTFQQQIDQLKQDESTS